jgi:serine/threonine protein kinase
MPGFVCPYCDAEQFRTGLRAGERVRCEHCQEWFVTMGQLVEDLELENPAATSKQLMEAVHQIIGNIPAANKYVIGAEIAAGGMGRILQSFDPYLRREIVAKTIGDQQNDEEKARFLEEAQITGQLEHPNIVPVHDIGFTSDGRLFFLMKKVQGKSLEGVLDALRVGDSATRVTFHLPRLLQILTQVCNAMAYAHSRGVIHRDLKPANIMLGDFGEVLVMDWGLAKAGRVLYRPIPAGLGGMTPHTYVSGRFVTGRFYRENQHAMSEPIPVPEVNLANALRVMRNDPNIWGTRRGTIVGTPAYMAPEQARGDLDGLDERSDIYALGAILYEMLTGTPPVMAATESAIVKDVTEGKIPLPHVRMPRRVIPPELSRIAMTALATAPEARYASVLDFQRDLRAFLDGVTVYSLEDNFWETALRLVRHYKVASFFTVLTCSLIVAGLVFYYQNQRAVTALLARDLAAAKTEIEKTAAQRHADKLRAPLEFNAAESYLTSNKNEDAMEHLRLALDYDPMHRLARVRLAELLYARADYEAALKEAERLLTMNANDRDGLRISNDCRRAVTTLKNETRRNATPPPLMMEPLPEVD